MSSQIPVINGAIRLEGDTSRLPKMVEDARRASKDIEREFGQTFDNIGRLAQQALSIPRNAGGSLDLNVGEYQAAAKAAQAHAIALREIANAARAAAQTNGDNSRETARYVQAANAAAIAAEKQAREAGETATAYQRLQAELDRTASATQEVVRATGVGTTANNMMVNSSRSLRLAMVQSGQQLQDIAISLYSGQRASVVFAQQLPQLAFALTSLEGSANKTHDRIGRFATFLSGPWGLAVGLATGVLASYIAGLISSGDESEKTGRATDRLSDRLDLTKNSYQSLIDVVNEYNQAQSKTEALTYAAITAAEDEARAQLKLAKAKLANLDAVAAVAAASGDPLARDAAVAGQAAANSFLTSRIAELEKELNDAGRAAAAERNRRAIDPRYDLQVGFDEKIAKLEEKRTRNLIDAVTFERERLNLLKQQKAALDAYDASQRKERNTGRSSGGSTYSRANASDRAESITRFLAPVDGRISSGFGQRRHPITGKQSFHAGVDYAVPVGTRVRAPADGVVKEVGRSAGNGIFVRLDHGAGTETTFLHLSAADVVEGQVLSAGEYFAKSGNTGMSTGPHLDYRVKVGGQNVDPTRGEFRVGSFAETAAKLEERAAEQQQRALEREIELYARIDDSIQKQADSIRDMALEQERNLEIQQLIAEGRAAEAEALELQFRIMDRLGVKRKEDLGAALEIAGISDAQYAQLQRNLVLEREMAREVEKRTAARQRELDLLSDTMSNLRQTTLELLQGKGFGAIGNLFKRQFDAVMQKMADDITEGLFGDLFRDEKDRILGFDKVKEASERTAKVSDKTSEAIANLGNAANAAANAMGMVAANDNLAAQFDAVFADRIGEITVVGQKSTGKIVRDTLKGAGKSIFGEELFSKITAGINTAMQGAALGQAASGLAKSLGIKQSKTGSQIGGAIGMAAFGPIGGLVGGFLGGTIGGAFKKAKTGKAQIGGDAFGNLAITGVTGSSGAMKRGASAAGDSVLSAVAQIAEALGGSVNAAAGSVTVGMRNGKYRVDPTGGGNTKTSKGAIDFGKDGAEAAIKYATMDLIKDGVIAGLRASTQRLLQAGEDLDAQLAKAVKFQSVFDRLDQIKDPVGSAVRTLNREFEGLLKIFREAGASAEEYAQLEELYGLERARVVKAANDQILSSLKGLYDDLMFGRDDISLRDRRAGALAQYNPLAERVRAGDVTAYDEFTQVATALLDIERQISGSQPAYFALRDEIFALTQGGISRQESLATSANAIASPLTGAAANASSQQMIDSLNALGPAVVDGLGYKLDAVNDNLAALIMQGIAAQRPGSPLVGVVNW